MFTRFWQVMAFTAILLVLLSSIVVMPSQAQAAKGKKLGGGPLGGVNDVTVTNGYYRITVAGPGGYVPGAYTVSTGDLHPYPNQSILYGGSDQNPWSSYNTIRVSYGEGGNYEFCQYDGEYSQTASPGYTLEDINSSLPSVTASGNTITTVWTIAEGDATVTQVTALEGTTLSDSRVRVTTTVTNNSVFTLNVGIRYLWDLEVAEFDNSVFRPRDPDGSWTDQISEYTPPAFNKYEITNSLTSPLFSMLGTTNSGTFTPVPTPPERFAFTYWDDAYNNVFDYTLGSGYAGDSAVLYYWGRGQGVYQPSTSRTLSSPIPLVPGESTSVTAYLYTVPSASPLKVAAQNATSITSSSAKLNGALTNLGACSSANVCFQYGDRRGIYDAETPPQTMSNTGPISATINLTRYTGETIYYRVKATGCGTAYSDVKWFDMPKAPSSPVGSYLPPAPSGPVGLPAISVQSASLSATKVAPGTPVTVTANVANTGTVNGTGSIKVYVNGELENSQGITVNSGSNTPVTFSVSRNEPGTYTVYVGGANAGSFIVDEFAGPGPIIIGVGLLFLIILTAIIIIYRRKSQFSR